MKKASVNVIELPNVTLAALSSNKIRETILAMKYSMREIKFGDCVFISHKKPFFSLRISDLNIQQKIKT